MRAGSVPLYRLGQHWPLHLAGAALLLALLAFVVAVHLAGAPSAAPDQLLTGPFRWLEHAASTA
jgi:hypothetical protein